MPPDIPMRIECKECRFIRTVGSEGDELPGEVIIAHGRETGHQLSVSKFTDDHDQLRPEGNQPADSIDFSK